MSSSVNPVGVPGSAPQVNPGQSVNRPIDEVLGMPGANDEQLTSAIITFSIDSLLKESVGLAPDAPVIEVLYSLIQARADEYLDTDFKYAKDKAEQDLETARLRLHVIKHPLLWKGLTYYHEMLLGVNPFVSDIIRKEYKLPQTAESKEQIYQDLRSIVILKLKELDKDSSGKNDREILENEFGLYLRNAMRKIHGDDPTWLDVELRGAAKGTELASSQEKPIREILGLGSGASDDVVKDKETLVTYYFVDRLLNDVYGIDKDANIELLYSAIEATVEELMNGAFKCAVPIADEKHAIEKQRLGLVPDTRLGIVYAANFKNYQTKVMKTVVGTEFKIPVGAIDRDELYSQFKTFLIDMLKQNTSESSSLQDNDELLNFWFGKMYLAHTMSVIFGYDRDDRNDPDGPTFTVCA